MRTTSLNPQNGEIRTFHFNQWASRVQALKANTIVVAGVVRLSIAIHSKLASLFLSLSNVKVEITWPWSSPLKQISLVLRMPLQLCAADKICAIAPDAPILWGTKWTGSDNRSWASYQSLGCHSYDFYLLLCHCRVSEQTLKSQRCCFRQSGALYFAGCRSADSHCRSVLRAQAGDLRSLPWFTAGRHAFDCQQWQRKSEGSHVLELGNALSEE